MPENDIVKEFQKLKADFEKFKEQAPKQIIEILSEQPADILAGFILSNTKLTDLQKSQICAILLSPASKTGYIG